MNSKSKSASAKSKKIVLKKTVTKDDPTVLVDFLAQELPLSKAQLKEAMVQGSCWHKKQGIRAWRRVRRAKSLIRVGDHVEFHFDPMLFERQKEAPPEAILLKKERDWSAWYKPAGLLTQGTKYGDSWSLARAFEKAQAKEPFLIHRLDRETSGVMVVAHNAKAAKLLSAKWRGTLVEKVYYAWVLGEVASDEGRLDGKIDGKKALTFYKVLRRQQGRTLLECKLGTGRTHQIRIHLNDLGHPVMGDPRYGKGNADNRGLLLQAVKLVFDWHGETKVIEVPKEFSL
jgi:tRNA pseudouridine32 synthase/23S rRNA pseudouridine746 synthase